MKQYNVAVVGATGMVGNKFLQVLTEKKLPVKNYYLYASAKSAGKVIDFMHVYDEDIEQFGKEIIWIPGDEAELKK